MKFLGARVTTIYMMEFEPHDIKVLRNMADYCLRHHVYETLAQEIMNKTKDLCESSSLERS